MSQVGRDAVLDDGEDLAVGRPVLPFLVCQIGRRGNQIVPGAALGVGAVAARRRSADKIRFPRRLSRASPRRGFDLRRAGVPLRDHDDGNRRRGCGRDQQHSKTGSHDRLLKIGRMQRPIVSQDIVPGMPHRSGSSPGQRRRRHRYRIELRPGDGVRARGLEPPPPPGRFARAAAARARRRRARQADAIRRWRARWRRCAIFRRSPPARRRTRIVAVRHRRDARRGQRLAVREAAAARAGIRIEIIGALAEARYGFTGAVRGPRRYRTACCSISAAAACRSPDFVRRRAGRRGEPAVRARCG